MAILLFLSGVLLGFVFGEVWVWITDKWSAKPVIKGYHLHHSLFFIPLFLFALYVQGRTSFILFGSGVGVIIQHVLKEGLKFVTKK